MYDNQVKDGAGDKATFWNLKFMMIDKSDNLYVCDHAQRIRKISPDGVVSTLPFEELIKNTKSTFEKNTVNVMGTRDVGTFEEMALLSNGNFLISTNNGCIYEVSADVKTIQFVSTGSYCNSFNSSDFRGVTEVKDGEDCKGCIGSEQPKPLAINKDGKVYFIDRAFNCIREIK